MSFQCLPTPPSSNVTHVFPPFNPALPLPPQPSTDNHQQAAAARLRFAEYYWPRHFEQSSTDLASFLERVFTDYANHERDLVGDWTKDLSVMYKTYRACLEYGSKNGTPIKAAEARTYQKVLQSRCVRLIARKRTSPMNQAYRKSGTNIVN